jgi:hypothetical protein
MTEIEILKGLVAAWEEIGKNKDIAIKILVDQNYPHEKRQRLIDELKPKLTQLQKIARDARKYLDEHKKANAEQCLRSLHEDLRHMREWVKENL